MIGKRIYQLKHRKLLSNASYRLESYCNFDTSIRIINIHRHNIDSQKTCLAPRDWILIEFINSSGIMRLVIRSTWNNLSSVITPERSGARFPAAVGSDTFDY